MMSSLSATSPKPRERWIGAMDWSGIDLGLYGVFETVGAELRCCRISAAASSATLQRRPSTKGQGSF